MKILLTICFSAIWILSLAQIQDTLLRHVVLQELTVVGQKSKADLHQLPEVVGTSIYAGKKSALLVLDNAHGNLATNTMRQVAAKIPGIYIWESEGSGIQINMSARGLSPNRSWEFNVRQNGYDIAADPYGYPEAYYNPQLQAVQRIEIVRGHGALQYGAQLGGMVNYILKDGSEFNRPIQAETFQTIGSNGLYNAYQAVGGSAGKWHYYGFYDHRQGEGWRANNRYRSGTGSGSLSWKPVKGLTLNAQMTRWVSDSQQPGGLTDEQFQADARQSFRGRNWFGLTWQTAAFLADYRLAGGNHFEFKLFSIEGRRSSVGYLPSAGITQEDLRDAATGAYESRTVDIDGYRNTGAEGKALIDLKTRKVSHLLSAGFRLYQGKTDRFRGGTGTVANDADFTISPGGVWRSEIDYKSDNSALFMEDLIGLNSRLSVIPGFRLEYVGARASGIASRNNLGEVLLVPQSRGRAFLLTGLGLDYKLPNATRLYFNSTQSYRPVQFADLTTPPTTDVVDPKLTDAAGRNTDMGWRGNMGDRLIFDVSVFHLDYRNRIGIIKQQRQDGSFYNLRTNVGRSRTIGMEFFTEFSALPATAGKNAKRDVRVFIAGTWMDARYRDLRVVTVSGNELIETNFRDRKVEYAPDVILRAGINFLYGRWSTVLQISHTGEVYTDANNTKIPTVNAQNGLVPSYTVGDWSMVYKIPSGFSVKGGINNILDARYFTRRASGYPGPGVLPADGRTFFVTVGYQMTGSTSKGGFQ